MIVKYCYHFVFLVVLLEVIFSHDSLKTLFFDHHLMCREQVNDHTSYNGCIVVLSDLIIQPW